MSRLADDHQPFYLMRCHDRARLGTAAGRPEWTAQSLVVIPRDKAGQQPSASFRRE